MTWSDVFKSRNTIFGVAAIWIVMFHVYNEVGGLPSYLSLLISRGNMGVDVFLFLSAYGLSFSIEKNSLSNFFWHRIRRVIVPFVIISLPYFLWYDFVFFEDGLIQFFFNIFTVNNWIVDEYVLWYIAAIIPFYLLYPVLFKMDRISNHISSIFIISISIIAELWFFRYNINDGVERVWSRLPVFMLGVLLSKWLKSQDERCSIVPSWLFFLCCPLVLIIFTNPSSVMIMRFIYGIAVLPFMITITRLTCLLQNRLYIKTALNWLGSLSLEIYIIHVIITRMLHYYDLYSYLPALSWYVLVLLITLPLAYFIQTIDNKIVDKVKSLTESTPCPVAVERKK